MNTDNPSLDLAQVKDLVLDLEEHQKWKADTHLDTIDGAVSAAKAERRFFQSAVTLSKKNIDKTDVAHAVKTGIDIVVDGFPVLLAALDELGKIHPFVEVAVIAFKTVYQLQRAASSADRKVHTLIGTMRDAMAVLLQLKSQAGEDISRQPTIADSLRSFVTKLAEDIKKCGSACDAYMQLKAMAKCLTAPVWDNKFAEFVRVFAERREQFLQLMTGHIGDSIDNANQKLDHIQEGVDRILKLIKMSVSPDQEQILAWIKQMNKNPEDLRKSKQALKDVINRIGKRDAEIDASSPDTSRRPPEGDNGQQVLKKTREDDLDTVWQQVQKTPDTLINDNSQLFENKFSMLEKQLRGVLEAVHNVGDRIIEKMDEGPYQKIIDASMSELWKAMGWRGSVKARHFILALRDHYLEEIDKNKKAGSTPQNMPHDESYDWALGVITANLKTLQPAIEVIDIDNFNLISIAEINSFTKSRPLGWSVPRWLAYWTIGWPVISTVYADKIEKLLGKMFATAKHAHPDYRRQLDEHLDSAWEKCILLTRALRRSYRTQRIQGRFQSYVDSEEKRIRESLEMIKYSITDTQTVSVLLAGTGGVEKRLLPLLYLLLSHNVEIIRLCSKRKAVDGATVQQLSDSMDNVFEQVRLRYEELKGLFREQKLDPGLQFKTVSCELFEYWDEPDLLLGRPILRRWSFPDHSYDLEDSDEEQEIQGAKVNDIIESLDDQHLEEDEYPYRCEAYDVVEFVETNLDQAADASLQAILGTWCGFLAEGDEYPAQAMISLAFHASDPTEENGAFSARGITVEGTPEIIRGNYEILDDGQVIYNFSREFIDQFTPQYFRGSINPGGNILSGTWDYYPLFGPAENEFVLSKLPPAIMSCRPSPKEFTKDKAKALWKFAISATIDQFRRRSFSWSFIKQHQEDKRLWTDFIIRRDDFGYPLDRKALKEFARCRQRLSPADAQFCYSVYEHRVKMTAYHVNNDCDSCGGAIGGARIVCIDCDSTNTLDLCGNPQCSLRRVELDARPDLKKPHLPSHSVFKVHTVLYKKDFGSMDRAARDALDRARAILAQENMMNVDEDQRSISESDADSVATSASNPVLSCLFCETAISQPCWYCITCEDDTFICTDCDTKDPSLKGGHERTHPVVKCQMIEDEEKPRSLEQRLHVVEGKLGVVEGKLGVLGDKLADIDSRLLRITQLLTPSGSSIA